MNDSTPTLTDPRAFRTWTDRQAFFERVMRSTQPVRPPFLHRLFFTGGKRRNSRALPPGEDSMVAHAQVIEREREQEHEQEHEGEGRRP